MKEKNKEKTVSWSRRSESIIIFLYTAVVTVIVAAKLLFAYRPNQNALGALGTVCMDVISMAILLILVVSFAFEKEESSRTTRLFLGLMLGTVWGLFWDFLTWSSDGSLAFSGWTYACTVISLCGGPILAGIFVMYLGSYLDDMYELKSVMFSAKICLFCNVVSFVITLVFAFTHSAFTYVDGHYETGALYDIITVIPILTLLYMTGYAICHIKIIGYHDVIAVAGYIFTMIIGAAIESIFTIGATYVSIAIADLFIFLLLQNKLIDRVKKQKEQLAERITSQFEILESMAGIYSHVNLVDLEGCVARRFDVKDSEEDRLDLISDPHTSLNKKLYHGLEDDLKAKFWSFTDLSTLSARMLGEKIVSAEFCHKEDGWFRAQYIRIGGSVDEPIKRVIYSIQNIDEEKKNIEKWIRKSNTDELTGFLNRHAYEDEISVLSESRLRSNFVYVSIDVNGLKSVNDTLGHEAGDELLVGACECMKQCFGAYGKLYRTGGDEFVGLIFADEKQLEAIKKDIDEVTESWQGKLIEGLAISCGYVSQKEAGGMNLHQIAVLADKRMYEDKTRYYRKKGIDRRGQRDAHVALCALYTKILKINITDDTYQIVDMIDDERTKDMGFADRISTWMYEFGVTGWVHPEDLSSYLDMTKPEYISEYFRQNRSCLSVSYRRKYSDGYRHVVMEMIPANDYTDDNQTLFLYVKDYEPWGRG